MAAKHDEGVSFGLSENNQYLYPVTSGLQNPESISRLTHDGEDQRAQKNTMAGKPSLLVTKHYSSSSLTHISTRLKEISQEDPDLQRHPKKTHSYRDGRFCLLHFHDRER